MHQISSTRDQVSVFSTSKVRALPAFALIWCGQRKLAGNGQFHFRMSNCQVDPKITCDDCLWLASVVTTLQSTYWAAATTSLRSCT